jgi:hypothetical protein
MPEKRKYSSIKKFEMTLDLVAKSETESVETKSIM